MTRAWLFSDLHLDVNRRHPFRLPDPHPACDVVIMAGDICEGAGRAVRWIAAQGFAAPVIYVLGNHECYGGAREKETQEAKAEAARHPSIHVLADDTVTVAGARIIGATLWTDYRLGGMAWETPAKVAALVAMSDHSRIITQTGKRWMPADAQAEHELSRTYIDGMLRQPFAGPTIVVTHHAPSSKSIHRDYFGSILNAAFASHMDGLVDRADLWVHGHVHSRWDYRIGDGRVVCNPRGYVSHGESAGFDPGLVVEVEQVSREREAA